MRPSDVMLVLPSRMSSVDEVESFVDQVIQSFQLTDDLRGNLLISLTEAVTNAIRHGNRLAEDKYVQVEVWNKKRKLRVLVRDEGCGFEPTELPDPTSPSCIATEGGRGVFLMRALSDEIRFFEEGTVVEMCYDHEACTEPTGACIAQMAVAAQA